MRDYNVVLAGEWNDGRVFNSGIVEVVPEPATAVLLLLGLCGSMGMRVRRAGD